MRMVLAYPNAIRSFTIEVGDMPRISKEASYERRNEIIDACEELYRTNSYQEITMSLIAEHISFGRANIYNYFQNKDEILLASLEREHRRWAKDLNDIIAKLPTTISEDELSVYTAREISTSIMKRMHMLKIMAMNLYDIEQHTTLENLITFKRAYKNTAETLCTIAREVHPGWSEDDVVGFVFSLMPALRGLYPYLHHTDKQTTALKAAEMHMPEGDPEGFIFNIVRRLLRA